MCLNYMTEQLFIVSLIILFIIILAIYINKNCRETFQSGSDSDSLGNMFNELDEWENKCNAIEERYQIKNDIDKIKQNEIAFNQLEEIDKKIYELKEIVKDLTIEKKRRDGINETCQGNAQIKLNQNYDIVNKFKDTGLKKQNIDLDFNISDSLESLDFSKKNKENKGSKEKCEVKNSKDYVDLDKTNLEDKCYRCDGDKLKENYKYLNNDFN
jgi:hypothetical protein